MGDHGYEGGAVHGYTVPVVGAYEGLAEADKGTGRGYCGGKWGSRERCGGRGGGTDDAVGCLEDEDDAGEGEGGGVVDVQADLGGGRPGGVSCGDGAEGYVDIGWGGGVLR